MSQIIALLKKLIKQFENKTGQSGTVEQEYTAQFQAAAERCQAVMVDYLIERPEIRRYSTWLWYKNTMQLIGKRNSPI